MATGLAGAPNLAAQPFRDIVPRSARDWRLESRQGDCPVTVSLGRVGEDPIWVFQSDSCATEVGGQVDFGLLFSDFGIPPQPPEQAEYWMWKWFVRNTDTADRVTLDIVDEFGHSMRLATSHALYDYTDDFFNIPDRYDYAWTTLSDAYAYSRIKSAAPLDTLGKIVGLRFGFCLPDNQETWLGTISFSPAREHPVPRFPRAHLEHVAEGRCLVADLDGDGVSEVVTPWMVGGKLWRYDRAASRFVLVQAEGDLGRSRPLHLAVAGDLDGDGDLDLVASDPNDSTLWVLTNRRGGFAGDTLVVHLPEVGAMLSAMTLADDDGDGRLDLFLGYHLMGNNDHLRIWRLEGEGGSGFGPPRGLAESGYPNLRGTYFLTLADLDGDGRLDLVSAAPGCGLRVFPGRGGGAYGPPAVLDLLMGTAFLRAVQVMDLDGDGRLDLFLSFNAKVNATPISGQNRLYLNRGGLRFDERAWAWGLQGDGWTQDASFTEMNGRDGPELVLLDDRRGIVVYDLGETVRSARAGGPVIPARGRVLDLDPRSTSGVSQFALQDLDGDGTVEAILSREDGISIVKLPGTGPVRRISVRGLGPGSDGIGATLVGRDAVPWRLPILSNHRVGPAPILVAASERVGLDESSVPADSADLVAGGMDRLDPRGPISGFSRFRAWLRHRAPHLWEYPWAASHDPIGRAAVGLLVVFATVLLVGRIRRGAAARTEDQSWADLLTRIGLSSHARWRRSVAGMLRIVREFRLEAESAGNREALRREILPRLESAMPTEVVESLRRGIEIAEMLGLEGARSARSALRSLDAARHGDLSDLDRLLTEGRTLENSMSLIQRALADRYSADAERTLNRVVEYCGLGGNGSTRVIFEAGDSSPSRQFPMRADDLFVCLEELISNAVKKDPPPGIIRVRVGMQGGTSAVIEVWDDGAPVVVERAREARPGTRRGLALLERLLLPYRGRLELRDDVSGGVSAEIQVPCYDLY